MKKIYLFFLGLFLLMNCAENNEVIQLDDKIIFSGTIINSSKDSIGIYLNQEKVYSIAVDSSGRFEDTFELDNGFYVLKIGSEYTDVYFHKGFDLNLTIDEYFFDKSIFYRGEGAAENNYLARKILLDSDIRKVHNPRIFTQLQEDEFLCKIDSIKNVKLSLLERQDKINDDFKEMAKSLIDYEMYNDLFIYPLYVDFYRPKIDFVVSENYPKPLQNLPLDNERLAFHQEYLEILKSKFIELSNEKVVRNDTVDGDVYLINIIDEQVKDTTVKNALLYYVAKYKLSYVENLDAFYLAFYNASTDDNNKSKITRKYNQLKAISRGNVSPNFSFKNIKGESVQLKDFKGKLVYIDLWATWCGPCIREIPALKALAAEFEGKDIQFVSIAANCDKEDWKKMLQEKDLKGVQLFAEENEKEFHNAYLVNTIPRFILIDKAGNIIDAEAKRPSNPELKKDILNCL